MNRGWFEQLMNPWTSPGLVSAIDRSRPQGPNGGRRQADKEKTK